MGKALNLSSLPKVVEEAYAKPFHFNVALFDEHKEAVNICYNHLLRYMCKEVGAEVTESEKLNWRALLTELETRVEDGLLLSMVRYRVSTLSKITIRNNHIDSVKELPQELLLKLLDLIHVYNTLLDLEDIDFEEEEKLEAYDHEGYLMSLRTNLAGGKTPVRNMLSYIYPSRGKKLVNLTASPVIYPLSNIIKDDPNLSEAYTHEEPHEALLSKWLQKPKEEITWSHQVAFAFYIKEYMKKHKDLENQKFITPVVFDMSAITDYTIIHENTLELAKKLKAKVLEMNNSSDSLLTGRLEQDDEHRKQINVKISETFLAMGYSIINLSLKGLESKGLQLKAFKGFPIVEVDESMPLEEIDKIVNKAVKENKLAGWSDLKVEAKAVKPFATIEEMMDDNQLNEMKKYVKNKLT